MRYQYGLEPWPQHYACLVDLLGRANRLQEALEIVEAMEMGPTAAVWCALLSACRIHSNMEVIKQTSYVLHDVEEVEKVRMLHGHSKRLALAYGLLTTPHRTPLRITKNLRVCGDCHTFTKLVSKHFQREIVVRDANRFHHFKDGSCSCKDFW
ncbi:hypothetical protein SASPL_135227 [Salvia splendens]|uniref:DYW domain-containing protein n=1 Tax=Salvia splendens TaxID=180675 RepID=A0A8X8WY94_SALSN|nr:hypothetical protein SASPL_135227 [Salvia splendens]